MSEILLIKHCAPTLAGIKTANIFTCRYENDRQLRCELCRLNRVLRKKGIRVVPLKKTPERVLIYAYRPARLRHDLNRAEAMSILEPLGYEAGCPARNVRHLISRLQEGDEFPHEIGLFLGYPPEDVRGFIEDPRSCKLVGYWKVYGDAKAAERLFARYKKCTDVYMSCYAAGRSIERLAVPA